MPALPVVAVDFNGILLDDYHNAPVWSDRNLGTKFGPFVRQNEHDMFMTHVWGKEREHEPAFLADLYAGPPMPGSELLEELVGLADLVLLSSGFREVRAMKTAFIQQHFPYFNPEPVYIGDERYGEALTKSEACRRMGAKVLLEDRGDYALDTAKDGENRPDGTRVVVVDHFLWSECEKHPRITHVADMRIAVDTIKRLLAA
jgi:hypothetical protein